MVMSSQVRPAASKNVSQHADMGATLLQDDGLALEVGDGLELVTRYQVVTGRPGQLHDHHTFGARVLADDFAGHAHHAIGAAQEG